MTKDEFLTILNSELENFEREHALYRQKANYFREINPYGKEFETATYELKLVQKKMDVLRNLVSLPAYARIQAMSDIEIDEYKQEKIVELESKMEEVKIREAQEKAKLDQLKAEQAELITKFGTLSGVERENAIARGQRLQTEISKYDVNNQWGIFASLQKEIQEIKIMQEQLKNKTSQEVKQQLTAEIEGSDKLTQAIEDVSKHGPSPSIELLAAVADDTQKAEEMANLLATYERLSNEQRKIKEQLYLGWNLPKELEKRLTRYEYYYDSSTNELRDPDKLSKIVAEFEEWFIREKNRFTSEFTVEKLSKLFGKEYEVDSSEVDMEFLQQHRDKLGVERLAWLENAVTQRNRLSKKIFKTREVKENTEMLNTQIKQEQSRIYKQLLGWYQSQNNDVLGLSYGVSFYNLERLPQDLERAKLDIEQAQQAISEVKEKIQKAKLEMEQQKQNYEVRKTEVAQQIRTLAGTRFAETPIPSAVNDVQYNLENIANASNFVYQTEVINTVQQEAQTQADTRESELRGITVEELLQIRQQVKPESTATQTSAGEEISQGKTR